MQTFLPYSKFDLSAQALDYKRLGKQRVEAYQILNILLGEQKTKGWINHPAVKMWKGYEDALILYAITITQEWIKRGYNDSMLPRFMEMFDKYCGPIISHPHWLDNEEFCRSHQSNLIRKDHDFYAPKFPGVPDDLPYVWPVK